MKSCSSNMNWCPGNSSNSGALSTTWQSGWRPPGFLFKEFPKWKSASQNIWPLDHPKFWAGRSHCFWLTFPKIQMQFLKGRKSFYFLKLSTEGERIQDLPDATVNSSDFYFCHIILGGFLVWPEESFWGEVGLPPSLSLGLPSHLVACANRMFAAAEQAWGETFSGTGLIRNVLCEPNTAWLCQDLPLYPQMLKCH